MKKKPEKQIASAHTTRGMRFYYARTKYNINGTENLLDVESATGVSRSTLSTLEDDTKDRNTSADCIVKLATHYGVSADYLLGLSDTPSTKGSEKEFSKLTGLSGDAIEALTYLNGNGKGKTHGAKLFNRMAIAFINIGLEDTFNRLASDPEYTEKRQAANLPGLGIFRELALYIYSDILFNEKKDFTFLFPDETTDYAFSTVLDYAELFRTMKLEEIRGYLERFRIRPLHKTEKKEAK